MNKKTSTLLFFGIATLAITNQASAECKIPEGSYKETCKNIKVNSWSEGIGCALMADCLKYDHSTYQNSYVVIQSKNGKFKNRDGKLHEY